MLIVRPVPDIKETEKIAAEFGKKTDGSLMAYYAVEAKEDGDTELLGLCLFTLRDGRDEIVSLDYAPATHDTEALIIMARAVMNFMYRCEVKTVRISPDVDRELTDALGFRREDGFSIDLEEFYKAPCRYGK